MIFQKVVTKFGIVVEGLFPTPDGLFVWRPLRNFGWYEGYANEFKDFDCPKLDLRNLKILAERFDYKVIYRRINSSCFKRSYL